MAQIAVKAKTLTVQRVLDKNTCMLNISGFRHDLLEDTIFPEVLKSLSDDVLVAHTHRYFLARMASMGKFCSCDCHNKRGSYSELGCEEWR